MIIRSKAPLRLGLAGGGTDVSPYCDEFGGQVLNVTIDRYAYCTIVPTDDGKIELISADMGEALVFQSAAELPAVNALKLHAGVYNSIVKTYNQGKPLSLRMTTYSDAPPGSGLGSSSTMVVAMLKAYMEWLNLPMGEYDMASLAYQIERVDLGLSGGRQDQYAATFGGLNFIEFLPEGRVIVNPLRIKRWIQNEIENSLILYYTGASRESAHIIDDQMENARTKNAMSMQGMHALKESALTMKEAVLKGDFDAIAKSLAVGWDAKKKTSGVISNELIESAYGYALANGARSAKISGAGGGGFMMLYCDPLQRYGLIQALKELGGEVLPVGFTDRGTQAWTIYD